MGPWLAEIARKWGVGTSVIAIGHPKGREEGEKWDGLFQLLDQDLPDELGIGLATRSLHRLTDEKT